MCHTMSLNVSTGADCDCDDDDATIWYDSKELKQDARSIPNSFELQTDFGHERSTKLAIIPKRTFEPVHCRKTSPKLCIFNKGSGSSCSEGNFVNGLADQLLRLQHRVHLLNDRIKSVDDQLRIITQRPNKQTKIGHTSGLGSRILQFWLKHLLNEFHIFNFCWPVVFYMIVNRLYRPQRSEVLT